jgi:hypothetical protein
VAKTLRPADFAVMTTAVLLNVRHDLATPADQHPMMAPDPVRVAAQRGGLVRGEPVPGHSRGVHQGLPVQTTAHSFSDLLPALLRQSIGGGRGAVQVSQVRLRQFLRSLSE